MWDIDNFPGAENVPWPLLIRARTVHEIDAIVASTVVRQVSAVASGEVARAVAKAAEAGVGRVGGTEASAEQRIAALEAAFDFDDLCPPYWHWPRPRPHFDDLSDPIASVVIAQARDLVGRAGSDSLRQTLGSTLAEYSRTGA